MLSHYKKAKKEGWQSDKYDAKVVLKSEGQQLTIELKQLDWFSLIEQGLKYSTYNITSEWHIYKNNMEIDSFQYYKFFDEINKLKDLYEI